MKLYLAGTAPGTEGPGKMLKTPERLLSYFSISTDGFNDKDVFEEILKRNENLSSRARA